MGKTEEKITLFKKAVEHFGKDLQLMVTCEEVGELIQAISKMQRFKADLSKKEPTDISNADIEEFQRLRLHILEEIIDSEIMFLQIFEIFDFTREERKIISRQKLDKLKGKLSEEDI